MDIFWSTIAGYNSSTWFLQLIIVIAGVFLTGLLLKKPTPRVKLAMKLYLLFLYLWIAVVYYYIYCAERSYNGTMALFWGTMAVIWIWDTVTGYTTLEENIQQKLSRLLLTAGMDQIDFKNRYVAIKMHFGEPGNLAYLRPNYAKTVADLVRQLGGKPFLTDCNTLYVGGRKNALDHIESAYVNGFTPYTTGCHIIIADGLKGSDDVAVPVDGEYVKNARIGRALMDADIVISLTHFKGHEATGIGGAIKNLGMGGGSRAGKKEMHADGKPAVNESKCIGCGACHKICAHDAPTIENRKMHIDTNKCVGCGRCIAVCPMDAIEGVYDPNGHLLNCKMAEYAKAVVQGRPSFHISLAMDISPNCDCHAENDVPVIPNVGMFASFDPVALDEACAEMCSRMPRNPNAAFEDASSDDLFHAVHTVTHWQDQTEHGEKIGLGSREYKLIEI